MRQKKSGRTPIPVKPALSFGGEFIGQERVRNRIALAISAAKQRNEPLGHILLIGPPGFGKATLADLIHNSVSSRFVALSGTTWESAFDFAGVLTTLETGDILLIEDIDTLHRTSAEFLAKPLSEFALNITIDSGPNARSVRLNLPPFTLLGTATRLDRIHHSLLSSAEIVEELDSYSPSELFAIAELQTELMQFSMQPAALELLLQQPCESPRDVQKLLRHMRDYAHCNALKQVDSSAVEKAITLLPDRRVLTSKNRTSLRSFPKDPLKRRYQVFVSSTFEDLKVERRAVMQALLETKCIPTGMELFPATGTEQWSLIKRVIDDCDYYVILLAGRYGSIANDGVSYTELEFDYAVRSGKTILGFVYSDTGNIVGSKLEKTDEGRRQLSRFEGKVKSRMCGTWSTPEGLASVVKSAILHAIEHDPKPGWIRAIQ